jgi:hypothetical protein
MTLWHSNKALKGATHKWRHGLRGGDKCFCDISDAEALLFEIKEGVQSMVTSFMDDHLY